MLPSGEACFFGTGAAPPPERYQARAFLLSDASVHRRRHTWQPAQPPGTVEAVLSVACPTNTICYALAIVAGPEPVPTSWWRGACDEVSNA
jgi:hypothetical protein